MHRLMRCVPVALAAAAFALPAASTAVAKGKPSGVKITSAACTEYAGGGWNITFTWTQRKKALSPTDYQLYDPSILNGQAASISTTQQAAGSVDDTYPTGTLAGGITDTRQLTLFTYVNGVEDDLATTDVICTQG